MDCRKNHGALFHASAIFPAAAVTVNLAVTAAQNTVGAGTDTWCLPDSLTLAQALSAAESPYELHVMEGMPHGFMQMSTLDGCRSAMRLMWEFLARNV